MSRTLAIMISLNRPLAVIYVLNIWTSGYAAGCKHPQTDINGRCCDKCPPGTYMKQFCSDQQQTVCSPCEDGFFSDTYNVFDRCEECRSCPQDYAEKCTPTTNANCSCFSGFLCSNNMCTKCEENKCATGEKPTRKAGPDPFSGVELIEYSYQCEPACSDKEYYDAKKDICKPWTHCGAFGLGERFPGNKTHDSICDTNEIHNDGVFQRTLGIGFILLSLTLFMVASYTCIKSLRKHRADNNPTDIIAVSTNTHDFHLSKEESGLIIQDESKDTNNMGPLHLERVNALC
ncbi:tumor necrosis factor receptor superfamily member 18 isoform X1 [Thunnus albacares]|uniref:tumor necrosis factor receptor superfamily member 18 isoform X1 n=2 Tax=Thunnus TaxID=8234 RepID=UPI001CF68143|nr:tumor necrosis factor receptor superfamily member 18 isoform X1 [Thunnus albacares]